MRQLGVSPRIPHGIRRCVPRRALPIGPRFPRKIPEYNPADNIKTPGLCLGCNKSSQSLLIAPWSTDASNNQMGSAEKMSLPPSNNNNPFATASGLPTYDEAIYSPSPVYPHNAYYPARYGPPPPEQTMDASLPRGWIQLWDPASARWYFVNELATPAMVTWGVFVLDLGICLPARNGLTLHPDSRSMDDPRSNFIPGPRPSSHSNTTPHAQSAPQSRHSQHQSPKSSSSGCGSSSGSSHGRSHGHGHGHSHGHSHGHGYSGHGHGGHGGYGHGHGWGLFGFGH